MWPAPSLDLVFQRAGEVTNYRDRLGERLVSMVFAPPSAAIWHELRYSVGHLDEQTGDLWDLFFIGVPAVAKFDNPRAGRDWSEYFQPKAFKVMADQVSALHRDALATNGDDGAPPWRHSGGTDLVSVMAYGGEPDWLSLKAVRLDGIGGAPRLTLTEVAARQVTWINGEVDDELSPGLPPAVATAADLRTGLGLAAKAMGVIVGGVAGNYAFEILKSMT